MKNSESLQGNLQDQHTLLFVFSPSPQDRTYQIQMEQFDQRRDALLGHDVVVAEVFEGSQGHIGSDRLPAEGCDGLRQLYHVPSGRFRVMLVGKDAHIKMVADSCVSFEEIVMRVENESERMEVTPT